MGTSLTVPAQQGWRPPQWARGVPALTIVATDQNTGVSTIYVFDGTLHADHEQQSVITLNPIQTGAPIADHAYPMPARLTAELMTSDAMQSWFVAPPAGSLQSILSGGGGSGYTQGYWITPNKQVSAFETLLSLSSNRIPVSVATLLHTYDVMLVSDVRAVESSETRYAGKFTVTFTQIFTAVVEYNPPTASDDPQATIIAMSGTSAPAPVPQSIQVSNFLGPLIPNMSAMPGETPFSQLPFNSQAASVPAAGSWSSIPTTQIPWVGPSH